MIIFFQTALCIHKQNIQAISKRQFFARFARTFNTQQNCKQYFKRRWLDKNIKHCHQNVKIYRANRSQPFRGLHFILAQGPRTRKSGPGQIHDGTETQRPAINLFPYNLNKHCFMVDAVSGKINTIIHFNFADHSQWTWPWSP